MSKIDLCPWCGSDDVGVEYDGCYVVECANCGAIGKSAETINEAIRKWNRVSQREWEHLRQQRDELAD